MPCYDFSEIINISVPNIALYLISLKINTQTLQTWQLFFWKLTNQTLTNQHMRRLVECCIRKCTSANKLSMNFIRGRNLVNS